MRLKPYFFTIAIASLPIVSIANEQENTKVTVNFHHPDDDGPITQVITITRKDGKLTEATVHSKDSTFKEKTKDNE